MTNTAPNQSPSANSCTPQNTFHGRGTGKLSTHLPCRAAYTYIVGSIPKEKGRKGERERGREGEGERERGREGEGERERGREGERERERGREGEGEGERGQVENNYIIYA